MANGHDNPTERRTEMITSTPTLTLTGYLGRDPEIRLTESRE